jgi:TrmH family RNA methyltransferase
MVGVCARVGATLDDLLATAPTLVTVLAHARDPGNVGTVIRCSDAAGVGGVVLTEASVDPLNPKAVRASAGSLFHLPVVTGPSAEDLLPALRAAGLHVLAADGAGERDLDDLLDDGSLAAPTAWVFGNEAWGLPEATRALCDDVVRVPIHGRAESLNLATAAAVCLYASARAQRHR